MKVSLVISTYNWKEVLGLCLLSVTQQTVIPTEVIIADDGSRSDTKLLIEEFKNHFPCPIKHVWHEDNGWRKCIIMNKAFADHESTNVHKNQFNGRKNIRQHEKF